METRYPIRKTDGTEYQRYEDVRGKLGSEQAGKWLVANNYQWHGGIHISGKNVPHAVLTEETVEPPVPLQCMAGGDIVALRVNTEYKEVPYGEDQKIKYSSTFVLVRSTHTPDSNKPNSALTFYTLYMHLAPLSAYPERSISLVIERNGLKKRTVTNHEVEGQATSTTTEGTFAKGTLVEVGRTLPFTHNGASKEFCTARKIENGKPVGDYFWVAAGEENLQPQSRQRAYLPDWMQEAVRTSTYDSVIIPATTIKIAAGSPIGFLGRDDAPNVRDEVQADWQSHIEVFSNDSKMPRFLSNPENLTSNEKGYIKAKEGASISKREDVDNVATFTPTGKTVSKDKIWRVVEPEQSIPVEDAEGKWWFQFDKDAWLSQEDVDELNPYDLIARNFNPLEQPPTDDFSETLVEPWVSKAFRWFGSTVPTDENQHLFWEGSAMLIENYTGGSIQKFMFKHLRGLLLGRLNFQDEGIAELRRRLIIKHDSEWYGKSGELCWKKILDECGAKERPWLTQWRDDVEWMSQVDGFKEKAQRQLWHFHPLEFLQSINQHASCDCEELFADKFIVVKYHTTYGPKYTGNLQITGYSGWDGLLRENKITEDEKTILIAMSENEGNMDAVQSYDSEVLTAGCMQKTVKDEEGLEGKGEFPIQLAKFRDSFPELYKRHVLDCGWSVEGSGVSAVIWYSDEVLTGGEKITERPLKKLLRKDCDISTHNRVVKNKPLAAIIKIITLPEYLDLQIIDFVERIKRAEGILISGYNKRIKDYIKSDFGRAVVLDHHVNRPGFVHDDFKAAVNNFFAKNPSVLKDPAMWGGNQERNENAILNEYKITRRMTKSAERFNNLRGKL